MTSFDQVIKQYYYMKNEKKKIMYHFSSN